MQATLLPTILLTFLAVSNVKTVTKQRGIRLEDDSFLQLLEVEIARTLRSELTSDDELQNLEGSGELDDYLKKEEVITPTTTVASSTTATETTPTSSTTTASTTTTTPLSTTERTTTTSTQSAECVQEKQCYKDVECPQGKCLGSELGICDCNACVTNKQCKSDEDCGGLRSACDSSGFCDCVKAFHSHGFQLFVKVLLTFCHQTKCGPASDNCYGLPCRVGKCICEPGTNSNLPVHYFTTG
ncbi:unnamed protein product [Caenorhabditis sp. 36 PRJEB53466]|nr:unnamed protein product [Caenorhabditis sp. 36 PRJEB53466]